jgi:hypothetical protein
MNPSLHARKKKNSQNNGKQAPKYYDQLWGKFNDALKKEESAVLPSHRSSLPQRNWWNWAVNCFHIHRILQI